MASGEGVWRDWGTRVAHNSIMRSSSRIPVLRARSAPPPSVHDILDHHSLLLAQHTRMLQHLLDTSARLHAAMPAVLAAERAAPVVESFCRAQTKFGKQCNHPLGREPSFVQMGERRWPVCGPHGSSKPRAVFDVDGTVVALLAE